MILDESISIGSLVGLKATQIYAMPSSLGYYSASDLLLGIEIEILTLLCISLQILSLSTALTWFSH